MALTGDGGDEVFAGYACTLASVLAARIAKYVPRPLLCLARNATTGWVKSYKGGLRRRMGVLLSMAADPPNMLKLLYNVNSLANGHDGKPPPHRLWNDYFGEHPQWPLFQRSLYCEMRGRLLDNFLVKIDVAAMANSMELRTPYLSRDLFDTVKGVGSEILLRGNTRKAILKKIPEAYLPHGLIYRPKEGFTPPLGEWLRDDRYSRLMQWVMAQGCLALPWVDQNKVHVLWEEHAAGRQDHAESLFALIAYCLWWKLFIAGPQSRDASFRDRLRRANRGLRNAVRSQSWHRIEKRHHGSDTTPFVGPTFART